MKISNRALWAILCVIVIVVLILAAVLLSQMRGGKGAAATAAAAAAAVAGGAALRSRRAYRGGRAAPRSRREYRGGRAEDYDPADVLKGADALQFPDDQKGFAGGRNDIQGEHQTLRARLLEAIDRYETARGAKLGTAATKLGAADAPATGNWDATDDHATQAMLWMASMCDIVRGNFKTAPWSKTADWSSAPWKNPAWPDVNLFGSGTMIKTRTDAWTFAKNEVVTRCTNAAAGLVTAGGIDISSKPSFTTVAGLVGAMHEPNVLPPPPAPARPGYLITALPADYALDRGTGDSITDLGQALYRVLTDYDGPGIRDRANIDITRADALAERAVVHYDALAVFYETGGPTTFTQAVACQAAQAQFQKTLDGWYQQVVFGNQTGIANAADYTTLAVSIKGPPSRGSIADLATRLGLPGLNFLPALPAAADVPRRAALAARQPDTLKDAAVAFSAELVLLRNEYDRCRMAMELNWTTLDPLHADVERIFGLLAATWRVDPADFTNRHTSADARRDLATALTAFGTALGADATFTSAKTARSPTAAAFDTRFRGLVPLYGDLELARVRPSMGPLPVESVKIAGLLQRSTYPRIMHVNLTDVANVVHAVTRGVAAPPPGWQGVRNQYAGLWVAGDVDTAHNLYAPVEQHLVTFAENCATYAMTLTPVYATRAETARAALQAALAAVLTNVQAEPLAARAHTVFGEAVRRVTDALAAVPDLATLVSPATSGYAAAAAPRPTESQRLIHLAETPKDSITFVTDPSAAPAAAPGGGADIVLEARTLADLEAMAKRLPASGLRMVYGLVVDKPGDMTALYKAVAISLKAKPPAAVAARVADRKKAATAWLYDVVRFESGEHYMRLREYVRPELYAVDV